MIYVAQKAHKNITHLCKAPIQGALEIRKRSNLQMEGREDTKHALLV